MKFENNYTRDTTFLIQQVWAQEFLTGFKEKFGLDNPCKPTLIHFLIDGSVEIWDNPGAVSWLKKNLKDYLSRDANLLDKYLAEYALVLEEIKSYWNRGSVSNINEFKNFLELARKGIFLFNIWYYVVTNKDTDEATLNKTLKIREEDSFFASSDIFIKNSLSAIYPDITKFTNAIVLRDLDTKIEVSELSKRMSGFALIDGTEDFTGNHAEFALKYPNFDLSVITVQVGLREVRGQIAFKGIVTGKVKVLRRRDQINDIHEGDIIVSPMTTPDFLPAMKRAMAFVTDEGGITCHAAIVARELRKPCIIGTKIATKVLKDGDMVEVDATTGIVKIL